jgi:hypothetical protein
MKSNVINKEEVKLEQEEKDKISELLNDTLKWLEDNQLADKEEFEHKKEELSKVCNPIMAKMYQGQGGDAGGMPNMADMGAGMGGMPNMADMAAGMAGMNMADMEAGMPDLSEKDISSPNVEDID